MSYHTVIQLTDTLRTILQASPSPEEAFEESYRNLRDLLDETRDASYHRTTATDVRNRFQSLHSELSNIAQHLRANDYQKNTWRTLQEVLHLSRRIAAAQTSPRSAAGPTLNPESAVDLLKSDPAHLQEQALQELRADPESILGAYLLGATQLSLSQHADAIATAVRLSVHYPARHVSTITALAAAMQGREMVAQRIALQGLHRRLEARRPQPGQRIPGLRTLSDEEAEVIRQINVQLVQQALHWCNESGWVEAKSMAFVGLLAPSLTQARHMLEQGSQVEDARWQIAVRCGLARCARWRCAFSEATDHLEDIETPFANAERALITRDRTLIETGELELTGFGVRLHLGRTTDSIGFALGNADLALTEHENRSETQLADLLKDEVCSWILTGFQHTILRRGPLSIDIDEAPPPGPESLFDVDRFFELYNAEDMDGIQADTDEVILRHPNAPTPWGVKALVYLLQGNLEQAVKASRQGTVRSACRALAAPQVLLPLVEGNYGAALSKAMENLSLRLRSATPELPVYLPGFPGITPAEGELLDQIEHNTWKMVEELLTDQEPEGEEQALELRLLAALIVPNPAQTLTELEELMPSLEAHLGMQAAACVALGRWRRHEGKLDEAARWLHRAERVLPGLSHTRLERKRLTRDRALMSSSEISLRGFGMTIEIRSVGRLLHRHFTPDPGIQTHALTGWVEDSREDAVALAMRDLTVSWLESGFSLLSDAPDE